MSLPFDPSDYIVKREFKEVPVNKIVVKNRLKQVSQDDIEDLACHIAENGLERPIMVNTDYRLLDGHWRLDAVKRLGWSTIPCEVITLDTN